MTGATGREFCLASAENVRSQSGVSSRPGAEIGPWNSVRIRRDGFN